ncbi:MAG: alanine--tRNA ligase-related protein, partial [Patescibacteria group bacterium]
MSHQEIRNKFIEFFKSKGHTHVPSSSLLPNDPSVLFTTAGMQQFKSYYTGAGDAMKDFGSLNTVSIQKSMRTSDIDEVGDESHLTFFEMLGNFSFGGYWKKEAIEYAYEFITKEMGLKIDYVTVFEGDIRTPADVKSEEIWKSVDPSLEVRKAGRADNFWGPTGNEGPCGPTTEIYVNGVEVWNLVFNEFYQSADKGLKPLETKGIDTGMGLERLAMVVEGKKNIFETDLFEPLMSVLPESLSERNKRIVSDHARASVFMVADEMVPSNKEQGYVLRRLLRRALVHLSSLQNFNSKDVFTKVINEYKSIYENLNVSLIIPIIQDEETKFNRTLKQGLKELQSLETITNASAFKLFESFGLPYEIIKEVDAVKAKDLTREGFEEEFK